MRVSRSEFVLCAKICGTNCVLFFSIGEWYTNPYKDRQDDFKRVDWRMWEQLTTEDLGYAVADVRYLMRAWLVLKNIVSYQTFSLLI